MFDPQKWIDSAPKIEDAVVEIGGEKIKIRRLNGTQWEQYLKIASVPNESSAVFVLHCGLVNEKTGGQFSVDHIIHFCNACPVMADKIGLQIVDVTIKAIRTEEQVFEESEKNSSETGTSP